MLFHIERGERENRGEKGCGEQRVRGKEGEGRYRSFCRGKKGLRKKKKKTEREIGKDVRRHRRPRCGTETAYPLDCARCPLFSLFLSKNMREDRRAESAVCLGREGEQANNQHPNTTRPFIICNGGGVYLCSGMLAPLPLSALITVCPYLAEQSRTLLPYRAIYYVGLRYYEQTWTMAITV